MAELACRSCPDSCLTSSRSMLTPLNKSLLFLRPSSRLALRDSTEHDYESCIHQSKSFRGRLRKTQDRQSRQVARSRYRST